MKWEVSNGQVVIPTTGGGYNYTVSYYGLTNPALRGTVGPFGADATVSLGGNGQFLVVIKGDFPRIYMRKSSRKPELLSVMQWGTNKWESMASAFEGCTSLNIDAVDEPDLSLVEDASYMFSRC